MMAISIWYVRKDTGLPDNSMPNRQVKDVDEAIEIVRAHKAGADSKHILRVHAAGGKISRSEHDRPAGRWSRSLFLMSCP